MLIRIILLLFLISCTKEISTPYNAEILSFEGKKRYCLYGYMIRINNDTILTSDHKVSKKFGYEIKEPIPVNIKLGNQTDGNFCRYHYYDIESIE